MRDIFKKLFNKNKNQENTQTKSNIDLFEENKKLTKQIESLKNKIDELNNRNNLGYNIHDEIYAIDFLKYNGELVGSSYVKTLFSFIKNQDVDIRLSQEAFNMLDKINVFKEKKVHIGHYTDCRESAYVFKRYTNPIFKSNYARETFKGSIDIIVGDRHFTAFEQIYNSFMKDNTRLYTFIREYESSIICDSPIKETKENTKIVRELKNEGIKTYLELYYKIEQKYKKDNGKDLIDLYNEQCYNEIITTIRTVKRYLKFFTVNSDIKGE